jgi:hypothetical protein
MKAKERLSKETRMLLGPKDHTDWMKWRAARDNRIQNPRRLKTVKDDDKHSADDSTAEHAK